MMRNHVKNSIFNCLIILCVNRQILCFQSLLSVNFLFLIIKNPPFVSILFLHDPVSFYASVFHTSDKSL